jgi:YD repeat-containing protein
LVGIGAGAIGGPPGGGTTKPLLSAVSRQPFGPVSALTYGNGIAETRTLDADYRVTKIASAVQNLSYAYDAANDVLAISDGKTAGNSQTLSYDALDRVTGA